MGILTLSGTRDRDKLLCSRGGWAWPSAYRKLIDFKFQPPALHFVLSACWSDGLHALTVPCSNGRQPLAELRSQFVPAGSLSASNASDCPRGSLFYTFPASLEDDSTFSSDQSGLESSQDAFGEEVSVAPVTEATGLLDPSRSTPGLPGMGQARLGFTHIHRRG